MTLSVIPDPETRVTRHNMADTRVSMPGPMGSGGLVVDVEVGSAINSDSEGVDGSARGFEAINSTRINKTLRLTRVTRET